MMKRRLFGSALLAVIYALVYALPLGSFLLMLSITNHYLLAINRTLAITTSTFCVLYVVFMRVYGGFRIGMQKSKPIISQMSLTLFFTDLITYVQLQIMNVNNRNKAHFEFFTADLLLMLAALAIQIVGIVLLTYLANLIYFRINPPRTCCVVTAEGEDFALITEKVRAFRKQFVLKECVDYRDPALYDKIRANQLVMLFHLPASVHQELIEYCYKCRKEIYFDLSIEDVLARNSESFLLDDVVMSAHRRSGLTLRQRFFKRCLDIALSLTGLIVLSPLLGIVSLAIRLDDHGPVIYRQERMTEGDRVFRIYKFRTMRSDESQIEKSAEKDDDRITRVGRVLRKVRLDELPQLINILKGDMSIVGPRPEMLTNVNKYVSDMPEFSYRARVKAGLTGYAQIAGKYNTTPREKLMMDISYIENYSFWLDVKLILKTLTVFFKQDSTEAFASAPAEEERKVG